MSSAHRKLHSDSHFSENGQLRANTALRSSDLCCRTPQTFGEPMNSVSETGDEPNFLARILAKARRQQPTTSGDMDLRPAPMDAASSSEERSWWWKKPSRKLTAFDLLYGLQAQEAAIGSTPSEVEVEVMGMAFQQTAARLEAMGEVEKAEVHDTGQCMDTARAFE